MPRGLKFKYYTINNPIQYTMSER